MANRRLAEGDAFEDRAPRGECRTANRTAGDRSDRRIVRRQGDADEREGANNRKRGRSFDVESPASA